MCALALAVLVRPPFAQAGAGWRTSGAVMAGGAGGRCRCIALAMVFLDARAIEAAQAACRAGSPASFGELTDFGKSSWFLVPIGLLLLLIAALASPRAGACLAARAGKRRGAARIPVRGDRGAEPVHHHHQAADRARAAAGRAAMSTRSSTHRSSGGRITRACHPGMPRPRSRLRSRSGCCGRACAR